MSGNNSRHWNDRNADKEAKYSVDSDEETNTASGSSVSKTESKFVMERQAVKGRGMRNSVHDANSRRPISNVRGTAHASNICSSIMVTEKARRPDHGNDGNRQLQMLGYRELQTMLTLDDKNLLIQVSGKIKNLEKLLNADKIRIDLMLLLLNAFGKCFQENIVEYYREHVTKLLALLIKSNKFRSHVVTFLTDGFTQGEKSQKVLSALSVILNIGELMCNVFPANVADVFTGIIPLMEAFIKSAGNDGFTVETEIVVKIDNLHKNVQRASRTTGDTPRMKKFEMESVQQPPNDFREIQVIPTAPELLNLDRPFIRRNLISGKYVDLNHYLDVHYRLLRHDFVAPLREGIAHYLDPSACRSRKWNKSVRIYENVYVLGSDLTKQGALFYFRLDENFLKRKLNFSKRLMTGSLVCLSKDRFETMSIGVVVDRKPEILQKGWIGVKIEISPEMIIEGCSKSFVFTMVESCSYFEAYRHVLERMKQITEDQILLHPCIVKCDSTGEPPDYLDESINYDFTSVCQRKPSSASIAVLHERQWPTADNLGLDEAQEAAMKMCIKNKVAIIQGPPGTGKTFLGLKVAKLLLNNSNIWSSDGSMLVVCYTNHALDQFLEGIMKFNRSIIRIGGRSKSESLMPYQLNAIRSEFPRLRGYGADRYQIIERQDEIKKTIEHLDQTITNCKKCILDEGKLYEKNVIDFSQHRYIELSGGMLLWLAVDSFYFSDSSDYSSMDNGNNSNEPENFDEDLYIDSDENDDISFEMEDGHDKKPNAEYLIRKFMPSKSEPLYSDPIQLLNDGWMQQGSKRDHKRRLQRLLNNEDVMSEEEANSVDVSRIHNLKDRWRLYRYWVKLFIQDVNAEIIQSHESYWREVNALQELNELKDLQVLKKAKVIGVTTTGAAKYWRLLQQLNLPVMIVEEAAEVFEAHIITALGRNTKHLILIGDHQQLRPSPAVYELAKKYNLDVSLFERLIKNDVDHVKLITQHRMRPEIARLICPHIYDRLLNHRSVTEYPKVAGVTSDVYFIDHRHAVRLT
ncbi:znfx1 (predicted) [Pycnogonum litorale]